MKDSTHDKLQIAGICIAMLALLFCCYVWLVRFQALPKPEWFKSLEYPTPSPSKP